MTLIEQLASLMMSLGPIPLFFWWVKVDAERVVVKAREGVHG